MENYEITQACELDSQASASPAPFQNVQNPGQVCPRIDTSKEPGTPGIRHVPFDIYRGNPIMMNDAFEDLDQAFEYIIHILQDEKSHQGSSPEQETLLQKFVNWVQELRSIRSSQEQVHSAYLAAIAKSPKSEGGLSAD